MASSALPDLDTLVAAIPGENPAGDPSVYGYELRDRFQELRREESPEDFDDATRPARLKKAQWDEMVELGLATLTDRCKDLRVVCHLLEGLAHTHGFDGIRFGLQLLRRLVDECWERILPPIDDGDLDSRASPLANMLDDPERGIRFPNTVRTIPFMGSVEDGYGLQAWNQLRASSVPAEQEAAAKVLAATTPDRLQATAALLEQSLAELRQLVTLLNAKIGPDAPGLVHLGTALTDCQRMVQAELSRIAPLAGDAPAAAADSGADTGAKGTSSRAITSRKEAYEQLRRAADLLQQIEPHSPIPYLVHRAVELGQLPFPQLIERLIRDNAVLTELKREMGIGDSSSTS